MGLKPVHKVVLCLADVLAAQTIDNVRALASDIVFGHVCSSGGRATDPACLVQAGSISAAFSGAGVARFGWTCLWVGPVGVPECRESGPNQYIFEALRTPVSSQKSLLKDVPG